MSEFDEEDPEVAAASAQGGYTHEESDDAGFVSLDAIKKQYRPDVDEEEDDDDELDLKEKLRRELTCAVCLSLFRDPIALRCGHAYCRACAATLRLRSAPSRARCPACRAPLRKGEDEETPTSVPLRNACRLLRTAEEIDADNSLIRARKAEAAAEERRREIDDALGECLVAASPNDPPLGWRRIQMGGRLVVCTRNIRREGASHRIALALRLDRWDADEDDSANFGVCVVKAEDDEDSLSEPMPLSLKANGDDDALIARDHTGCIVLEGENDASFGGPWASTASLVRGEAWFSDIDVWGGGEPWESVGDWLVLDLVDAECGLELRIAVHRHLGDDAPRGAESDESSSDGSRSSRYESDGGFIVADEDEEAVVASAHARFEDEDEEAVELSADAQFSDDERELPARRTGHMSPHAAQAALDAGFLDGLGDAGGAESSDEEEEEEPVDRRKRPRR